jgi:4'-phosphopantetheinyl transferase EntD
MVALGVAPEPVLRSGQDRAPAWPRGLVGSITHTDTFAAAAVGFAESVVSVGIDAEPDAALPDRVLGRVAFDAELSWVEQCGPTAGQDVVHADRLLFSAKEAIYKAWHPLAGSWLGFDDARVTFDPAGGTFEADILVDGPVDRLAGRYAALDGVIVTAVELPRRQR